MHVIEIFANLPVSSLDEARSFYRDFLGLTEQDMGLDWVTRFRGDGVALQAVTADATAAEDSVATLRVDDVDAAYVEAGERGYEIVHPLVTEPWGVRRFFVRAPGGAVLNIAQRH